MESVVSHRLDSYTAFTIRTIQIHGDSVPCVCATIYLPLHALHLLLQSRKCNRRPCVWAMVVESKSHSFAAESSRFERWVRKYTHTQILIDTFEDVLATWKLEVVIINQLGLASHTYSIYTQTLPMHRKSEMKCEKVGKEGEACWMTVDFIEKRKQKLVERKRNNVSLEDTMLTRHELLYFILTTKRTLTHQWRLVM